MLMVSRSRSESNNGLLYVRESINHHTAQDYDTIEMVQIKNPFSLEEKKEDSC